MLCSYPTLELKPATEAVTLVPHGVNVAANVYVPVSKLPDSNLASYFSDVCTRLMMAKESRNRIVIIQSYSRF